MAVKQKAKKYSNAFLGAVLALQSGQARDLEQARQREEAAYITPTRSVLDGGARQSRSYTEPRDVETEEEDGEEKNYPVDQQMEFNAQRDREANMRETQENMTGMQAFPLEEPNKNDEDSTRRRTSPELSQTKEELAPESAEPEQNPEVLQAEALREAQARDANQQTAVQNAEEERQSAVDSAKQQKKQMSDLWTMADLASIEGIVPFFHLVARKNKELFQYYMSSDNEKTIHVGIGQIFFTLWIDLALLLAPVFQLAVFLIPLTPIIAVAAAAAWLTGIFN